MKQMTKVAFLAASGFEDSEMKNPYEAIAKNGNDAVIISLEKGAVLTGKQGTISYTSHLSAEEANIREYAAIIIPGGSSPSLLLKNKRILQLVKDADQAGITIAAICHGPQLLAEAGLLKGRTLTSYPGLADEIRKAGGNFVDRQVVVDKNWITSRTPQDEPAFIEEIINRLGVSAY